MTAQRGFTGITTFVVASMIATLPLLAKCMAMPTVDFSDITIRFSEDMLQRFYDCLCGDNVQTCILHYQKVQNSTPRSSNGKEPSISRTIVQNVTSLPINGPPSSIFNGVTFICDEPSIPGSWRNSCSLKKAHNSKHCACVRGCFESHINETHSTLCTGKCVNIEWNSCNVEYKNFQRRDAPLLNSCSQPMSSTFQTSMTAETTETLSTTEGNFVSVYENPTTTYENPTTIYEKSTTTYENGIVSTESTFTTDINPRTAYENLTTTYETLVASAESTLTTDRNPVTTHDNFDTTIKNNSTTNENHITINRTSEMTIKFDRTSKNLSGSQTLVIAVGVSGAILAILIVSAIIAFLCRRCKSGETNNTGDVQRDPMNHNQKNDYWILEAEYTDSSPNRISGNMYSPVSECYSRPYETDWKNTKDSYELSMFSEEKNSVTEGKKAPLFNNLDKIVGPVIPQPTDVAPSGKRGKETINNEDPAYCVCHEEIEPNDTGFTLYSLAADRTRRTCLEEKACEANSGHLNRETNDEKSTESGQNTKNYQKVLVTCNHDSQPLPEINEKAEKQKDQGEYEDNYAKIDQIGEMDTVDLSTYDCESQSFSSIMKRQNSDQDEGGDKFAKMNDIKEAHKGDLTKKKPESEICSETKEDKNARKDVERPADSIYTGLGQTEEINDSDLATYDQESQTFCRLMDGSSNEKGKDGNNSAEIIYIKEPLSSQLQDEQSEDKDKDDMNDNYTEIGQITDSQSSSKVENERNKERDKDDLNDNYAEIVQMNGPHSSFKLKDEKSEERDKNYQNDTYAEIGEVTEMIDNGPARHDYELQSLSYIIDEKTPENNTDGPTVNTYARLGQKEEADDSDLATYNHESETFSKLIDENDEEKDEDSKHDQDSTLAQTKKPAVYELAICNHEPESVSNQLKERMV